jgi:hypothetical protein
LIIIGDDQSEMFLDDNMPAIAIYGGDTFLNSEGITVFLERFQDVIAGRSDLDQLRLETLS